MEVVLESLKCEVIVLVWLSAYPSFVRWIVVWLSAIPLSVEAIEFVGIPLVRGCICLALCLASSERLYLLREELCTLKLYLPKSSVEVPCVGSPVWTI